MGVERRTAIKLLGAQAFAAAAVKAGTAPAASAPATPATPATYELASHRRQVRIQDVDAFAVKRAVFVKVTADDGSVGWGEAGHSGGKFVAQMINGPIDDLIKGMDVFDIEPVWARMFYETDEFGPGGIASQAIAGIDCALWDLRGKLLGQPVWALLGGKFRAEIPLYGSFSRSIGGGAFMTARQVAAKAEELAKEGFKVIKVRLGIREENANPDPDPARETVAAVRRAVGDNVELYVDANNGYRAARAIEVGRMLREEFNVTTFEEPVAAYHYASLAKVADSLDLAVSAGEHEYNRWMFRDLILNGKVDILNPDVSKMAGLTEARKVAALAEVFDLPIAVHNARPTLLTAAHAHFIAASQTATRPQEHPGISRLVNLWQYFNDKLVPENGILKIPDTPGLGLSVDEDNVRKDAQ